MFSLSRRGAVEDYFQSDNQEAEARARAAIPDWVWKTIGVAGAAAIIACFATGVCEFAALVQVLGAATAAVVIVILKEVGICRQQ